MSEGCERCLELEDEFGPDQTDCRGRGRYSALSSSGGNPQYDADAEARRWLAAHPRASLSTPGRALVASLVDRTQTLLEWRRRWDGQAREISLLRSRIAPRRKKYGRTAIPARLSKPTLTCE